jgi:murein DD-endopeptidase MepM/ murein hydrolase activator NlpD
LRKRFYILFVARDAEGQLHKIHIPVYYLYVLVIGAALGLLSVTGIVGSYARMLSKVSRFNELRDQTEALKQRYSKLEQVEHEKDIQVASLGSLASEVSALYGLKPDPILASNAAGDYEQKQVSVSMDQLHALRTSALSGAAMIGIGMGINRPVTMNDWIRASAAPALWPVMGRISASFGERIDPFNGEGAFHRGVDICTQYGEPIIAPADGEVAYADFMNGYGRTIILEHGHGLTTLYGHLSSYAVISGQQIHRGDVIGYVGLSGRSTGPHLHYEVRINDVPVNPYKYLRITVARETSFVHTGS